MRLRYSRNLHIRAVCVCFQGWLQVYYSLDFSLKVPKREIFATELFILSDPILVGDLRNEPKKPICVKC